MKKSELQQIIKEEIQKVLEIEDPIQTAFHKAMGFTPGSTSGKANIMRPKHIDIRFTTEGRFYKALVDGKSTSRSDIEDLLKRLTRSEENISLRLSDDSKLEEIQNILADKNIKFTWDDSMDVS